MNVKNEENTLGRCLESVKVLVDGKAEVRIMIKDTGENVVISIVDNGKGMKNETVEQLLDGQLGKRSGIGIRNKVGGQRIYF